MEKKVKIYSSESGESLYITLSESDIKAGFPSPAEDHSDLKLDLNKELIKNPSSTFFARVSGESMIDDGVDNGDLLVIDKSVTPFDGAMAVCYIDGEFTLKRVKIERDKIKLVPANSRYKPIEITNECDFQIWGVVRYLIKKM